MYSWACLKCEKKLDVLRTFDGYREPPTSEEAGGCLERVEEDGETRTPDV
jgi:hypothetical protein